MVLTKTIEYTLRIILTTYYTYERHRGTFNIESFDCIPFVLDILLMPFVSRLPWTGWASCREFWGSDFSKRSGVQMGYGRARIQDCGL